MPFLRNLLSYIGINPERLRLDWVSSSEAPKFVRVTTEFVDAVRELGPLEVSVSTEALVSLEGEVSPELPVSLEHQGA